MPGQAGLALEPFPRQTLVGIPGSTASYLSPLYDSTHWKSVAWWFECYGSLPGLTGPPLTAYIETSESMDGPWVQLDSQTASAVQQFSGDVSDPGSLLRIRIAIQASEVSSVGFRIVARVR